MARRKRRRKRSVFSVASKRLTHRQKANWHARQIMKQLKKKKTNWQAVRYHKIQMKRHRRFGVFKVVWK